MKSNKSKLFKETTRVTTLVTTNPPISSAK